MPKLVWSILAIVLALVATLGIVDAFYLLVSGGLNVEYGFETMAIEIVFSLLLFLGAYVTWKKARVSE